MAKNNPVTSWMIRQVPKSDPKFHQAEMLGGVGRSIRELFTILIRGWVFRRLIISFCS